ncbi:cell division protein ZipA C-terminal FtsZ-binding domain-containing protein [Legionella sp. km772]|uniref:cell division protein ZipA C-terminal FtsZ-binding domain-containing protein n=1 Tax=Legionella sp. km772 TaxID=2498111 RepID=UPI000F8C8936|nr:cell division protein ZipA C-terminal FtsZ-binding domain-containing protein [Legionella sp. km772]RUR09525.1 cell division protein ZipA [Legionella sp. km772]
MPANWSLILNILLLIGVVIAIGRLMKARRESLNFDRYQPHTAKVDNSPYDRQPLHDDIIAVRKVNSDEVVLSAQPQPEYRVEPENKPAPVKKATPSLMSHEEPVLIKEPVKKVEVKQQAKPAAATIMMFLLAKENRNFVGYELLQTVLASGLRYGEGHLFHRHQSSNGQGPIQCSLAAATATGVFDLQNIGAFSVRGLCLFMQVSKDPHVNAERFSVMLETAKQLSEGLNAHLLDEQRKPLNEERIAQYYRTLNIEQEEHEYA